MANKKIPVDYLEEMWNKESPTQDDMRSVIEVLHKITEERDRWYRVHHSHVRYNQNVVVNLERKHKYCRQCGAGGVLMSKDEMHKRFNMQGDVSVDLDKNPVYCALCTMKLWKDHFHMKYNNELVQKRRARNRDNISRQSGKPAKQG